MLDPAWIALIGTLVGGAGLKAAEHWLGRNKVRVDDAARIRDELRLEITSQREEITKLENDVDKWREQYYTMVQKYTEQTTSLTIALEKIRAAAELSELQASKPPLDNPPAP